MIILKKRIKVTDKKNGFREVGVMENDYELTGE